MEQSAFRRPSHLERHTVSNAHEGKNNKNVLKAAYMKTSPMYSWLRLYRVAANVRVEICSISSAVAGVNRYYTGIARPLYQSLVLRLSVVVVVASWEGPHLLSERCQYTIV